MRRGFTPALNRVHVIQHRVRDFSPPTKKRGMCELSWILNTRPQVHTGELGQYMQEQLTYILEDRAWKSVGHELGTEI